MWKLVSQLSLVSALSFAPPYEKNDFTIKGDAKRMAQEVQLASGPNKKGSVWTSDPVPYSDFTLEALIRSQPDLDTDVGASGFSLWYTEKVNPPGDIHGGSDKWDGLAVMVDSLIPGSIGMVRGHLNDGSTKFASLKELDKEALSLCNIPYRNALGPIRVRIGYSEELGFAVDVNGQKCFVSTEISLPMGYFGVSANTDKSGDTLSILSMNVHEGMLPQLAEHLPGKAKKGLETDHAVKGDNSAPKANAPHTEARRSSGSEVPADALTREDVNELVSPLNRRLEALETNLGQAKSAIDQLVDTLSISLDETTKASKEATVKEFNDAPIINQIKVLEAKISELKNSSPTVSTTSKLSTWETLVLAAVLPIPTLFALVFYDKHKKRNHDKLL